MLLRCNSIRTDLAERVLSTARERESESVKRVSRRRLLQRAKAASLTWACIPSVLLLLQTDQTVLDALSLDAFRADTNLDGVINGALDRHQHFEPRRSCWSHIWVQYAVGGADLAKEGREGDGDGLARARRSVVPEQSWPIPGQHFGLTTSMASTYADFLKPQPSRGWSDFEQ